MGFRVLVFGLFTGFWVEGVAGLEHVFACLGQAACGAKSTEIAAAPHELAVCISKSRVARQKHESMGQ